VATLEIERGSDRALLKFFHRSGDESDDGVAMLRKMPSLFASTRPIAEEYVGPGIEPRYLDRLPLVAEIDLRNLAGQYYRSSSSTVDYFDFTPGERYAITVVSELIVQTVVAAG